MASKTKGVKRLIVRMPRYTSFYYYGKDARKEAVRGLGIARSLDKMSSISQTKKGYVLRVGGRN